MTDIAVIILVGKEELHIRRCLEKLAPLEPRQIFVVESQKGDRTHEVAVETANCLNWRIGEGEKCLNVGIGECSNGGIGECLNDSDAGIPTTPHSSIQTFQQSNIPTLLSLVWHDWPGLYAKQFNWALDALWSSEKGKAESEKGLESDRIELSNPFVRPTWILRLDADEYLTPETIEKLKVELPRMPEDVTGLTLELKRRFCGGEIGHGTTGIRLTRIFRSGVGRCEERAMDEHIVLSSGRLIDFDGAFYDDNLNDMDWWRAKHRGYARREAADALAFYRGEVTFKPSKAAYYRWPPYLRAFIYFGIRYFLKLGFLDGYAGWMWNFWQGLWYRLLVDREIRRAREGAHRDV